MLKILFLITVFMFVGYADAEIESGVYLNPTVGYAIKSNHTGSHATNNYNYSIGVFGGYALDKHWAIDGNLTYLPNTSNDQFNNYFMSGVAIRGSVWLSPFFSPYLRLGGGFLSNASQSLQTSSGVFFGIGGLFELTPKMGITVDNYGVLLPSAPENNFSTISVGFDYGF